jgi:hypothetical protein
MNANDHMLFWWTIPMLLQIGEGGEARKKSSDARSLVDFNLPLAQLIVHPPYSLHLVFWR